MSLSEVTSVQPNIMELGYNGTLEKIFTANHPEVNRWTAFFHSRVEKERIFQDFESKQPRSMERARVVGVQWRRFSDFMPWFLCQAATLVSSNEKRHYVIQTAFEELGMRDVDEIHPHLFWNAAQVAGVTDMDLERLSSAFSIGATLYFLEHELMASRSDAKVLGMLLGLEIPAIENIETTFTSLAHSENLVSSLAKTKFFSIHRQVEIEHVRLTISNFLRFCITDETRQQFVQGFDAGIEFWKQFWSSVSHLIDREKLRGAPHASSE